MNFALVGGVGVAEYREDAADRGNDAADLLGGHPSGRASGGAELGLGGNLGGVDFGGPAGDEGGVGAGVQGGAVAGQALVAVVDDPFGFGDAGELFLSWW